MTKSINDNKKPRGRPATGIGQLIGVRMQPDEIEALDQWINRQDDKPTRPEAVRRLVGHGLDADQKSALPAGDDSKRRR